MKGITSLFLVLLFICSIESLKKNRSHKKKMLQDPPAYQIGNDPEGSPAVSPSVPEGGQSDLSVPDPSHDPEQGLVPGGNTPNPDPAPGSTSDSVPASDTPAENSQPASRVPAADTPAGDVPKEPTIPENTPAGDAPLKESTPEDGPAGDATKESTPEDTSAGDSSINPDSPPEIKPEVFETGSREQPVLEKEPELGSAKQDHCIEVENLTRALEDLKLEIQALIDAFEAHRKLYQQWISESNDPNYINELNEKEKIILEEYLETVKKLASLLEGLKAQFEKAVADSCKHQSSTRTDQGTDSLDESLAQINSLIQKVDGFTSLVQTQIKKVNSFGSNKMKN
jgi:hypothetical protein